MSQILHDKTGNTISYADFGNKTGFPLLIQHGLIASIKDYELFEGLMRLGVRLISIARPGYGASPPYKMSSIAEWADIVSVLIDELDLPQFDILGMSSGGPYSYAIGYKFPDRVRNIFIFSGIPALYDEEVLSFWPYEVKKNASIAEMEKLAYDLFFSNLSEEDLAQNDVRDSMMNNCFGLAQDFRLRCMDWGFRLSDVPGPVYMRHSKFDPAVPFSTAEITSKLLPNCIFEARDSDVHFSKEALDDFIRVMMAGHYTRRSTKNQEKQ